MKRFFVYIGALAIAFSAAAYAAPEKDSAKKEKPAAEKSEKSEVIKAVRDGDKVTLTWTLPAGDWRSIDILRNEKDSTKGRGRIKNVRATTTTYTDATAEAGKEYWYWLKVSTNDKKSVNFGPVKAE